MRPFDYIQIAIDIILFLVVVYSYGIVRAVAASLHHIRLMIGALSGAIMHQSLEKYIGKPIPPVEMSDLRRGPAGEAEPPPANERK